MKLQFYKCICLQKHLLDFTLFKMTLRNIIKFIVVLIIVIAVAVGLTSINHPIILKWVAGSAKHHGNPMPTKVYANGRVTDNIKVYYTDEENNYLLSLTEYDSLLKLKFIKINLNEKWIGTPVGSSKNDFDIIAGHLFESKTGGDLSPFQDSIKGLKFNPQLSYINKQIKFNLPPNKLKFDSVRIELP